MTDLRRRKGGKAIDDPHKAAYFRYQDEKADVNSRITLFRKISDKYPELP